MPSKVWFNESRSWRGRWWLPGDEVPRYGELSYAPDGGLRLELVGSLSSQEEEWTEIRPGVMTRTVTSHTEVFDVVLGLVDGRRISLLDCTVLRARGQVFGDDADGEQDLRASTALFGIHIESGDDAAFDRVEASIEGLTLWSGLGAITLSGREKDPGDPPDIGASLPEDQVAHLGEDIYKIMHSVRGYKPEFAARGTSVSVLHKALLVVHASGPSRWNELLYKVRHVVELVSLARRSHPGFMSFRVRQSGIEKSPSRPNAGWVDMVWQQSASTVRDERVAFTAEGVGFEHILQTWLDRRDDLINSTNLVQAAWRDGDYLESSVMSLATATESLGSVLGLPQKMPTTDYKAMVSAMLQEAPDEQRGWLAGALGNMNGPSLKQKATAVANRLPEVVRDRLLPSLETWARLLVRVRNDLSHSGSTKTDFEVLASLRQVTSAAIYLALLGEIGLSEQQIGDILESDGYLRYACERSARDLVAS